MGKIAFVFPGQGAQESGMGLDAYNTYAEAKEVFDKAAKILDFDLKALCFEVNEDIHDTAYTQPALVTTSMKLHAVIDKLGFKPDYVAGLSLGEYSALAAAGAISLEDAVMATRRRGLLMQKASQETNGSMAAIMGASKETILEICGQVDGILEIANYNNSKQIVISGEKTALAQGIELFKEKGIRAVELQVSGAFHSSLMQSAADGLHEVLDQVTFSKPLIPYVNNVHATIVTEAEPIKELLIDQVTSSVRWDESIELLVNEGVDLFVEIGPGKTLAGLIRKINRKVKVVNVSDSAGINELVDVMNEREGVVAL